MATARRWVSLVGTAIVLSSCGSGSAAEAPINPTALALIAEDHVDAEAVGYRSPVHEDDRVQVWVSFDVEPDREREIGISIGEPDDDRELCAASREACEIIETDRGDVALDWYLETFESDPGSVRITYLEEGLEAEVWYSGPFITGDPRDLDLALDIEDLIDIVADERLDWQTDEDIAMARIPGFPEPDGTPSDTIPATPQALIVATAEAQGVSVQTAYEVSLSEEFGESTGARLVDAGNPDRVHTITAIVVLDPPPDLIPRCPDGWECQDSPEAPDQVYAWSPGVHMVSEFAPDGSVAIVIQQGPTENDEQNPSAFPILLSHQAELMAPEMPRDQVDSGDEIAEWDGERVEDWDLAEFLASPEGSGG